ncbi:MAG: MFS transporter [Phycisphaeraceae bacterium]
MSEKNDQISPVTLSDAPPMGVKLGSQLSIMMFLQYAIWGAWLPILWPFLFEHRGFAPGAIGTMFAVGALGALLAPFVAGQIADRYFNTEKFLGISHIIGGILVFQLANIETFTGFLVFSLVYSIVYSPTLPLTNSLAFHHLPDRDRDFGRVRLWGTIGWIVVGIGVGQWLLYAHTVDEKGANEQLVKAHIIDADGRKLFNSQLQVTVTTKVKGEDVDQHFKGTVYDQTDAVLVLNTATKKDETQLRALLKSQITASNNVMDALVRPEHKAQVLQAIADLDAGKDAKAIEEALMKHSELSVVRVKGDESAVGADVVVQLKSGKEVTGKLLARTDKVVVIEVPEAKELTVILAGDVAAHRKAEGESIIGKVAQPKADPVVVVPADGASKSVARKDLIAVEHYGVFTLAAAKGKISANQAAGRADAFKLSGVLGIIMGIFCFALPRTPPSPGKQTSATAEAWGEIKKQPLLTLFLLAVPISCIHQFYFVHTSSFLSVYQAKAEGFVNTVNSIFGVGGGGLMTVGQMSELFVLAAIPLVAKRWSRKRLLTLGIIAYALRMFLFAYVEVLPLPPILTLILGVALHGFCFGCFIFVAFMVVDEETTGDVRASAQSLFNLVIVGIGIIVGSKIADMAATASLVDGKINYSQLFSYPMWGALVCLIILLAFYPGGKRKPAHPD